VIFTPEISFPESKSLSTSRTGLFLQAVRKHPHAYESSLLTTSHLLSPQPFSRRGLAVRLNNFYPQTLGIDIRLLLRILLVSFL
jgi:hypothetical protein